MEKIDKKLHPKEVIKTLKKNLQTIDRVGEWADAMGYRNTKIFSRKFRNRFGKRPKRMMIEIKVEKAIEILSENSAKNFEIAHKIGKKDEQALYQLIKNETGYPPKFYRENNKSENIE